MNIGIFVSNAYYTDNVPVGGEHIVPLRSANIIAKYSHNTFLITTKADNKNGSIPIINNDIKNILIKNISKPLHGSVQTRYFSVPSFMYDIYSVISEKNLDVIHLFGSDRLLPVAFLLTFINDIQVFVSMTSTNFLENNSYIGKIFLSNRYNIATFTKYTRNALKKLGYEGNISITRPGVSNVWLDPISEENKVPCTYDNRVLFWRDAEWENGADICVNVFAELANTFDNTEFVFAVRPDHEYESEMRALSENKQNINLFVYPYHSFSIIELVKSSDLSVLPFRTLSLHPQISVLESLASGTPLITSPVESNSEIVHDGENALVVKPCYTSLKSKLEHYLNSNFTDEISSNAKAYVRTNWSWKQYERDLRGLYV